jgi:hypothetical protein
VEAALRSGRLCVIDVECARDVTRYGVPVVVKHGTMPFPYSWELAP